MNWFPIALACAFLTSCCDATSKALMRDNDEWIAGTGMLAVGTLLLAPVLFSVNRPPVSEELVLVLAIALPLEVIGYWLFLSAIRLGPLSLTVPLLALTPVFTVLTSAVILGERISYGGAIGILLVAVGAYLLNADPGNRRLGDPVRAAFSNPGARRMVLTALVWSVTSTLGKQGTLIYGALPFGIVLLCGIVIVFFSISLVRVRRGVARITLNRRTIFLFGLGGLFLAGMEITHFVSLSLTAVAYMISVKRLSLVFGVLLGALIFGEKNVLYRAPAACVMTLGIFLIRML